MEREILPEEQFLVGKWTNIIAINPDGEITDYDQGNDCFELRRDAGSALRKYTGYKPSGYSWFFKAQDSTLYTFKYDSDSLEYLVRYIADNILLITTKRDSMTRVQKLYTGEKLTVTEEELKRWGY